MYKYIRVGDAVQNVAIPEDYQIDREVKNRIRQRYSPDGSDDGKPNELEMHSRGLIDPNDEKFQAYLAYRQECLSWGASQKAQAAADKEKWADWQWDEESETRSEFIARLQNAGLL